MNLADLTNLFSYHALKGDQAERYEEIRNAALHLVTAIVNNTPQSADQTVAIRKVREAVMTANAAIAVNE